METQSHTAMTARQSGCQQSNYPSYLGGSLDIASQRTLSAWDSPKDVKTVMDAYRRLSEWPAAFTDTTHSVSPRAMSRELTEPPQGFQSTVSVCSLHMFAAVAHAAANGALSIGTRKFFVFLTDFVSRQQLLQFVAVISALLVFLSAP